MKLWVGCESRCGHRPSYRGYALLVDWDKKEVLGRYEAPDVFDESLPETAVGRYTMGVRNVHLHNGQWHVATNGGVIVLDLGLKEVRRYSNNWWNGGHVFEPYRGGWLFESTYHDALVWMDGAGKPRWHYALGSGLKGVARKPAGKALPDARPVLLKQYAKDKEAGVADIAHINSLQLVDDAAYLTLCSVRAFARVWPEPAMVLQDRFLKNPHDFRFVNGSIVVNDSGNAAVVIYDRETGKRKHAVVFDRAGEHPHSKGGWTRGMLVLDKHRVLVGHTPLTLAEIDIGHGKVLSTFTLSSNLVDTCHGLTLVGER